MTRFNVYYTDRAQPDSSFVNRVWYEKNNKDLTVELHGVLYQYRNVPQYIYNNLVNAFSPGNYYRSDVQGVYKGDRLGAVQDAVEVAYEDAKAVAPGNVYGITITTPNKVQLRELNDRLKTQILGQHGYAAGGVVTPETPKLSLSKDVAEKKPTYPYTVTFLLEGDTNKTERKYDVQATSEDDALEQLFGLVKLLDQKVEPVALSVRYN